MHSQAFTDIRGPRLASRSDMMTEGFHRPSTMLQTPGNLGSRRFHALSSTNSAFTDSQDATSESVQHQTHVAFTESRKFAGLDGRSSLEQQLSRTASNTQSSTRRTGEPAIHRASTINSSNIPGCVWLSRTASETQAATPELAFTS